MVTSQAWARALCPNTAVMVHQLWNYAWCNVDLHIHCSHDAAKSAQSMVITFTAKVSTQYPHFIMPTLHLAHALQIAHFLQAPMYAFVPRFWAMALCSNSAAGSDAGIQRYQ
jgi:hypothetical protein